LISSLEPSWPRSSPKTLRSRAHIPSAQLASVEIEDSFSERPFFSLIIYAHLDLARLICDVSLRRTGIACVTGVNLRDTYHTSRVRVESFNKLNSSPIPSGHIPLLISSSRGHFYLHLHLRSGRAIGVKLRRESDTSPLPLLASRAR
jgi:hypothetical protein